MRRPFASASRPAARYRSLFTEDALADLKVGISLPTMGDLEPNGYPGLTAGARHVEDAGLDSVSACDFIMGTGTPALEATLALSAAAAVTERVLLRFGVMTLPLRDVAWVA